MTPRDKLIEAMAQARCGWCDPVCTGCREGMAFVLDAALAALPGLGLRVVPVEATEAMIEQGWIDKEDVTPAEIYRAMLAAAPGVLAQSEGGE